jgi:uncharacterized protein (UPF0210 family)
MSQKIIRSICYFTDAPSAEVTAKLASIAEALEDKGYLIQTKRLCSAVKDIEELADKVGDGADYLSVGTLTYDEAIAQLPKFNAKDNAIFNIDLTNVDIDRKHVDLLFQVIREKPGNTFNFTFVFNNAPSSPYFPSASYEKNGFAIGLQPTDLSEGCATLDEWFAAMKSCWDEIAELFRDDPEFLGIDSSIAPLSGSVAGSFVGFIKRLGYTFERTATTDFYVRITKFIKENNPKLTGLSGLMLPCLEDDELAAEYNNGNFSIERNVYLSLHSGLGIDTYPIGINESPERVVEILKLVQALSNKYKKPLSARFVSDGKAKIGDKTDFQNQYLTDCTIRAL